MVLRIILLGKTGAGKSATGNTILGKNEFISKNAAQSVTKTTSFGTNEKMKIIDTPGFFDSSGAFMSREELHKEIVKSVGLCGNGPHAFLYVIELGRYTEEEMNTTKQILDLFGENIYQHIIIVLTFTDKLDDDQTLEQFVQTFPRSFRDLLQKSGNRFLGICNKHGSEQKAKFVDDLMEMVEGMVQNYGSFKNEMVRHAQAAIELRIQQISEENPSMSPSEIESTIDLEITNDGKMSGMLMAGGVGLLVGVFLTSVLAIPAVTSAIGLVGVKAAKTVVSCSIL